MWGKIKNKKYLIGLQCFLVIVLTATLLFTGGVAVEDNNQVEGLSSIGIGEKVIVIGHIAYAAGTADYSCDGAADDVQFQVAIDALPATGGKLVVLAGVYSFNATVARAIDNVTIEGMGFASFISRDGINPIFTIGVQSNWTFVNLRLDVGGVSDAVASEVTYENIDIGGTHWAYGTSGDIGGASWDIPSGRSATLIVAASDAGVEFAAQADYKCDGTNDEVEIQAAENAANGGTVILSDGTFEVSNLTIDEALIIGQYRGTRLNVTGTITLQAGAAGMSESGRLHNVYIYTNAIGGDVLVIDGADKSYHFTDLIYDGIQMFNNGAIAGSTAVLITSSKAALPAVGIMYNSFGTLQAQHFEYGIRMRVNDGVDYAAFINGNTFGTTHIMGCDYAIEMQHVGGI